MSRYGAMLCFVIVLMIKCKKPLFILYIVNMRLQRIKYPREISAKIVDRPVLGLKNRNNRGR